jgi:hypothetical protein
MAAASMQFGSSTGGAVAVEVVRALADHPSWVRDDGEG